MVLLSIGKHLGVFLFVMSIKTQGFELNRTLTNFLDNADFGAFTSATQTIILKGDAARRLSLTGFCFNWSVGLLADINANHLLQVVLVENLTPDPNTNISIFPEANNKLRFSYVSTAPLFRNQLTEQFTFPFKLTDGITYALVAIVGLGAALAATSTSFFTAFGFEENEFEKKDSIYRLPR